MKSIEDLKKEQYDLKAKLHEVIELINGEEYHNLPEGERGLINQQRVGMELYLSCLTKRIYGNAESPNTSNLLWLTMLYGMFNSSCGFNTNTKLSESDFDEPKDSKDGH